MVESTNFELSISRSSFYYQPKGETALNLMLMRLMRLLPIYQKPNTSKAAKNHKTYSYLLKGLRGPRSHQGLGLGGGYHLPADAQGFSTCVSRWTASHGLLTEKRRNPS